MKTMLNHYVYQSQRVLHNFKQGKVTSLGKHNGKLGHKSPHSKELTLDCKWYLLAPITTRLRAAFRDLFIMVLLLNGMCLFLLVQLKNCGLT